MSSSSAARAEMDGKIPTPPPGGSSRVTAETIWNLQINYDVCVPDRRPALFFFPSKGCDGGSIFFENCMTCPAPTLSPNAQKTKTHTIPLPVGVTIIKVPAATPRANSALCIAFSDVRSKRFNNTKLLSTLFEIANIEAIKQRVNLTHFHKKIVYSCQHNNTDKDVFTTSLILTSAFDGQSEIVRQALVFFTDFMNSPSLVGLIAPRGAPIPPLLQQAKNYRFQYYTGLFNSSTNFLKSQVSRLALVDEQDLIIEPNIDRFGTGCIIFPLRFNMKFLIPSLVFKEENGSFDVIRFSERAALSKVVQTALRRRWETGPELGLHAKGTDSPSPRPSERQSDNLTASSVKARISTYAPLFDVANTSITPPIAIDIPCSAELSGSTIPTPLVLASEIPVSDMGSHLIVPDHHATGILTSSSSAKKKKRERQKEKKRQVKESDETTLLLIPNLNPMLDVVSIPILTAKASNEARLEVTPEDAPPAANMLGRLEVFEDASVPPNSTPIPALAVAIPCVTQVLTSNNDEGSFTSTMNAQTHDAVPPPANMLGHQEVFENALDPPNSPLIPVHGLATPCATQVLISNDEESLTTFEIIPPVMPPVMPPVTPSVIDPADLEPDASTVKTGDYTQVLPGKPVMPSVIDPADLEPDASTVKKGDYTQVLPGKKKKKNLDKASASKPLCLQEVVATTITKPTSESMKELASRPLLRSASEGYTRPGLLKPSPPDALRKRYPNKPSANDISH